MQAKDILDEAVLCFLLSLKEPATWGMRNDRIMPSVYEAMPVGTPCKVQRAKMQSLIRRGLVEGCSCGCRGDFVITRKGMRRLLERRKDD